MTRDEVTLKRSVLAVPGSSEKMITKARTIDVDEIFLDLEDSVAPSEKSLARSKVIEALLVGNFKSKLIAIRVNEQNTKVGIEDVSAIVLDAGKDIDSLIIPKVETADEVIELAKRLDP
jgi:citrate lyase subunit beta/citryl-CoA lyase